MYMPPKPAPTMTASTFAGTGARWVVGACDMNGSPLDGVGNQWCGQSMGWASDTGAAALVNWLVDF
jgi:hypothetical protein